MVSLANKSLVENEPSTHLRVPRKTYLVSDTLVRGPIDTKLVSADLATMSAVEIVVPIKSFSHVKQRLQPLLTSDDRERLMQRMARSVLRASAPYPVWVVCDDPTVAAWAEGVGASPLLFPQSGLSTVVKLAVLSRAKAGAERIVIAHGDLPLVTSFEPVVDSEGVHIVTDRSQTGTKVLSIPAQSGFDFFYGPFSAHHHRNEAHQLGLPVFLEHHRTLGFDVNTPSDLDYLRLHHPKVFAALTTDITSIVSSDVCCTKPTDS